MKVWSAIGLIVLGGALGAFVQYLIEQGNKPIGIIGSATDSPVVVRGGSISAIAGGGWTPMHGAPYVFTASVGADTGGNPLLPNSLSLDGVDKTGGNTHPDDVSASGLTSNWDVKIVFRKTTDGAQPTSLHLCTHLNASNQCQTGGPLGNTVYVVDPDDTFPPDSTLDRNNARIHLKLNHCDYSTDIDPACSHISDVIVSGTGKIDRTYHCVDGACDVGASHQ